MQRKGIIALSPAVTNSFMLLDQQRWDIHTVASRRHLQARLASTHWRVLISALYHHSQVNN
jgi:hypothetical protein